ncbi:MAG: PQQ-dependent sugar dehydrogenase, partial [Dehalococcoidia bacterium]|nr:PQQ-dependent sugar dehydrogenase [Dehalococcoidia bacterium]
MIAPRALPAPAASLLICLFTLLTAAACAGEALEAPATSSPSPVAPIGPPGVQPLEMMEVERVFPSLSFARMTYLTHAGDGSGTLFVTLQPGVVMFFQNDPDAASADTFLDIRHRVSDKGNEEGLLGLAFDPKYAKNGHFYVYYSAADPRRSVLSRFSVPPGSTTADPASELVLLEIPQPFSNHNGGQVAFGPDGYLYVGLGDGGRAGDPFGNGQDRSTLLGSILRIDVGTVGERGGYGIPPDNPFRAAGDGSRPEIWAYGLRNPWRFSFDLETGDLWVADVGQNQYEEVDLIEPGGNYGWNVMEGNSCFSPSTGCSTEGLVRPVVQYGREDGCSITGGYVYRGSRLPALRGRLKRGCKFPWGYD